MKIKFHLLQSAIIINANVLFKAQRIKKKKKEQTITPSYLNSFK